MNKRRILACLNDEYDSNFSSADLYADIDAYCLKNDIENTIRNTYIDHFKYHFETNYTNRINNFTSNMDIEDSYFIALEYLTFIVFDDITLTWNLSLNQKQAFAYAYVDYIYNFMEAY